jgi:hypothetical protein
MYLELTSSSTKEMEQLQSKAVQQKHLSSVVWCVCAGLSPLFFYLQLGKVAS